MHPELSRSEEELTYHPHLLVGGALEAVRILRSVSSCPPAIVGRAPVWAGDGEVFAGPADWYRAGAFRRIWSLEGNQSDAVDREGWCQEDWGFRFLIPADLEEQALDEILSWYAIDRDLDYESGVRALASVAHRLPWLALPMLRDGHYLLIVSRPSTESPLSRVLARVRQNPELEMVSLWQGFSQGQNPQ